MPDNLGETLALATAIVSLVAAETGWLTVSTRKEKGPARAAVTVASTALPVRSARAGSG
jgi:hypothetical protein